MAKRITGPRWQAIVRQIVARDGGRCHLCDGFGADSADHVVPLADGGSNSPANLRAVHRYCNLAKNGRRSARIRNGEQPPGQGQRRREWPGAIDRDPGQPPPRQRRVPDHDHERERRAREREREPGRTWPGAIR